MYSESLACPVVALVFLESAFWSRLLDLFVEDGISIIRLRFFYSTQKASGMPSVKARVATRDLLYMG